MDEFENEYYISWNLKVIELHSDETISFNGFTHINSNYEIDEDEADEILSEWVHLDLNEENKDNSFIELANEYRNQIINFSVNYVSNKIIEERRIYLEFDVDFFPPFKSGDDQARMNYFEKKFKDKYPNLSFLKLFSYDSDTTLEKSNGDKVSYILSFILTPFIYKYLNNTMPSLLDNNELISEEREENEVNINSIVNITNIVKNKFESYNGVFGFLEGSFDNDPTYAHFINRLKESKKDYITIKNLYKHPENLKLLVKYNVENLILKTTGMDDRLSNLIEVFIKMKYIPKNVFIIGENNLGFDINSIEIFKNVNVIPLRIE